MQTYTQTFTLTFGDQAENHVGMQKIGELASEGFNLNDLQSTKKWFEEHNATCGLINLAEYLPENNKYEGEVYVLVIRNGLGALLAPDHTADDFYNEQNTLQKDDKAFMYGRVVSKKARHNLCFADTSQEPDYANGKGRLVAYDSVPLLKKVRTELVNVIGEKARDLMVEGNYYYDKTCGIGFHGDAERMKVVGVRVGATIPLHYQWFQKLKPVGERVKIDLDHGDMYIMSEKATGNDWRKKNILTLRHAAGAEKYLTIKEKEEKKKPAKRKDESKSQGKSKRVKQ
jgi:alkylated DNA repair dioxygenase AlkB